MKEREGIHMIPESKLLHGNRNIKKILKYWTAGNFFTLFMVTVTLIGLDIINAHTISYYPIIAFIFYMTSFFWGSFIVKYLIDDFHLFYYGSAGIISQLIFRDWFLKNIEDLRQGSQFQLPLFPAIFLTILISASGELAGFYIKYYVRKDYLKYWALGNLITLGYLLIFSFTALCFFCLCRSYAVLYITWIMFLVPFFASGFTIKHIKRDLPFYYYGTTGLAVPSIFLIWFTYAFYDVTLLDMYDTVKGTYLYIIIVSTLGGFTSILLTYLKNKKLPLKESFNVIHKYEFITLLDYGNMGEVYLAERVTDKKKVVIKKPVFSPEAGLDEKTVRTIYAREAELMRKFNHPGLPEIYDFFQEYGRNCIVMEYIEGKTLEYILKKSKEKPLPIKIALRWVMELADILDYLHNSFASPVVYKDLKPSNIIITREGKVRLIDFGTCRYYSPDKKTDTYLLGTPGYAAPEQYKKTEQTTPRTDVFSLGVILYQLLTNYDPSSTPFKFPRPASLNSSINNELEKIITGAIELDSLKRFISVMELREELEKYLNRKASPTLCLAPVVP